jgi:hypothetical protein
MMIWFIKIKFLIAIFNYPFKDKKVKYLAVIEV